MPTKIEGRVRHRIRNFVAISYVLRDILTSVFIRVRLVVYKVMEWNGMKWSLKEWNGIEWNGMDLVGKGTEWNVMEFKNLVWML